MDDVEIRQIAERVLRPALADYKYQHAEVRTGLDASDEPAIFVDAVLGEGAPILEPRVLIDAHVALSQGYLARGETRFPYLRMRRTDDEYAEDSEFEAEPGHA